MATALPANPATGAADRNPRGSHRTLRLITALVVSLGVLLVPAGVSQAAPEPEVTQGIDGTVSLEGQVGGASFVSVYPLDPTVVAPDDSLAGDACEIEAACRFVNTDANGKFAIALPSGEYKVYFRVGYTQWAGEWWQDSLTRQDSTTVTVEPDQLTTLNPELAVEGKITGTVAQVTASTPGGFRDGIVEAWVTDPTYPLGRFLANTAWIEDDGSYTIDGLAAGSYLLHFYTRLSKVEGWWQGQTTSAAATPVTVTAANTTADINPTGLLPLGRITGKVTSATDGTPVEGTRIVIFRKAGNNWVNEGLGPFDEMPRTAADGTYSILAPQQGTYRLVAYPADSHFRNKYWPDATTAAAAQEITVSTNQVTPNIDLTLDQVDVITKTAPSISGTRRVGSVLTAGDGTWRPTTATTTRQWLRNGAIIPGAVQKSYALVAADLGKTITVRVTAQHAGLTATTVPSPATAPIAAGLFRLTSAPSLLGTLKVGRTMRAVPPRTTPGAVVTYQWLRRGLPIPAARSATYKLVKANKGRSIGVRITLKRPGYATLVRVVKKARAVR
ncbi:hypothetical protein EFK50_09840 [Nocardioides marmoriginsengisoli]|uniref:Uncharacterized protein n=1 Tax=Nocardioides marmoriginsengisoli TaxID=661483 RepID=A0A3N0CGG6_9ACTN|nr:carboxypeptidase regulatory-like domain-containing protein [Nocardioides marmoriginsengisoli]RNL62103.1 hypothetical protein EFK50_09840 [Nocardioides marmoriginsengisoli]